MDNYNIENIIQSILYMVLKNDNFSFTISHNYSAVVLCRKPHFHIAIPKPQDYFSDSWMFVMEKYPIVSCVNELIFVIAHEVGHIFYGKQEQTKRDLPVVDYRNQPSEAFADTFAAKFIRQNLEWCLRMSRQIESLL